MSDTKLRSCLSVGCSPADWYRILNSKVFFWPTKERVLSLISARAYKKKRHTIITVDSNRLLTHYSKKTFLSRINSGAIIYRPTPRGPATFVPFEKWPDKVRPRVGTLKVAVVELAINYGIPDIREFIIRVDEARNGRVSSYTVNSSSAISMGK